MKALSLKAPWAFLVCLGMPAFKSVPNEDGTSRVEYANKVMYKTVENRPWPLPKSFTIPQRVIIHVSRNDDGDGLRWLIQKGFAAFSSLLMYSRTPHFPRGALIGEVDIVGCVTSSANPWFTGPYGFVLENPDAYKEPIPYRGRQRLFEVEV